MTTTITMQPGGSYRDTNTFTVDGAGVLRNVIGRAAMPDMVRILLDRGQISQDMAANTLAAYDREISAFLAAYRAADRGQSAEVRAGARAAHGPGVELVDVVTGRRWTT